MCKIRESLNQSIRNIVKNFFKDFLKLIYAINIPQMESKLFVENYTSLTFTYGIQKTKI